ncbi:hypothetical protein D5H78_08040 [Vallicoccus soli]|uniref:Uncharacterized protein n=1 Tax=Vallicoccus soli TaxID=2339232 RepID=A0A3A3Z1U5_9ACTN|nr:hypothetical protein D5H78_08040 [Vallicoccus soli]
MRSDCSSGSTSSTSPRTAPDTPSTMSWYGSTGAKCSACPPTSRTEGSARELYGLPTTSSRPSSPSTASHCCTSSAMAKRTSAVARPSCSRAVPRRSTPVGPRSSSTLLTASSICQPVAQSAAEAA